MSGSYWSCGLSQHYHLLCICQVYTLTALEWKDSFSHQAMYGLAAEISKTVHACLRTSYEILLLHFCNIFNQSPADALASFKGLHKHLGSNEGIDGKREPDAIIVSEVVVELPQILSLQA